MIFINQNLATMEPKKNPQKDPARFSSLFFSVAIALLTLTSLFVLEAFFPINEPVVQTPKSIEEVLVAEIPMDKIVLERTAPVQQVVITTLPTQASPDNEVEDNQPTPSPDPEPENSIVPAAAIPAYVEPIPDDVPLSFVHEVPVFPGCERVPKEQRRSCLEQKIRSFIANNQKFPESAYANRQHGKVWVEFLITNTGSIQIVQVRSPYPVFENEARRVINKMPKMIPGKQNGKEIHVRYTIPITFKYEE